MHSMKLSVLKRVLKARKSIVLCYCLVPKNLYVSFQSLKYLLEDI